MEYFTPQEAAQLLKVHVGTLLRWIREGKLSAIKIGKGYRISQTQLDKFLVSRQVGEDK